MPPQTLAGHGQPATTLVRKLPLPQASDKKTVGFSPCDSVSLGRNLEQFAKDHAKANPDRIRLCA